MIRVTGYIDGFNLYFGLKAKGWRRYYWLDPVALIGALLRPGQQLTGVHFFTARIRSRHGNQADLQRQTTYLDALATLGELTIHEGHFLEKPQECKRCGNRWPHFEEKMSDVNLATQLLMDAVDDDFDTALLVSADSDLVTPVRQVARRFSSKRIVAVMPPERHSQELQRVAHAHLRLGRGRIANSQLPEEVESAAGHVLRRPPTWR